MSIAILVIADGRDQYLDPCMMSLPQLSGDIAERWIHDDTGDPHYRSTLADRYPGWRHINAGPRSGCAAAFQSAWRQLRNGSECDHIFLVEQDFVFPRPVPLPEIADMLTDYPYLAQVALRRQPWNSNEIAAGGVVEQHPEQYMDCHDDKGRQWLQHRMFFTTNPCLIRRTLLDVPWPSHQEGCYSEGLFHHRLLAEGTPEVSGPEVAYGYWGARDSGTWVEHIGYQRIGMGY
jgi:hypothetical protein